MRHAGIEASACARNSTTSTSTICRDVIKTRESETKAETKTRQAETETETKTREAESKTKTKTSRVETKTSKSGLDRSRDQDQVSRYVRNVV